MAKPVFGVETRTQYKILVLGLGDSVTSKCGFEPSPGLVWQRFWPQISWGTDMLVGWVCYNNFACGLSDNSVPTASLPPAGERYSSLWGGKKLQHLRKHIDKNGSYPWTEVVDQYSLRYNTELVIRRSTKVACRFGYFPFCRCPKCTHYRHCPCSRPSSLRNMPWSHQWP